MWKSPIEASRRGECAITYKTFWWFDNFRSFFSIWLLQEDLEVGYDMKRHFEIPYSFVIDQYERAGLRKCWLGNISFKNLSANVFVVYASKLSRYARY